MGDGRCLPGLQRRAATDDVIVAVDLDALLAADGQAERVAEVLRRAVVDDRIDARVEVGEPGTEDEDGVEQIGGLSRRAEERDEQQEQMDRQPEQREDNDDQDQQTADLPLAVTRTRLFLSHTQRHRHFHLTE